MDNPKQQLPCGLEIEPADPARTATALHCFTRQDGVHFCPSEMTTYGVWNRLHVFFTFELGRKGLFVAWTPEGAREAAQILLDLAARAEANLAEDAAAQLANLGKGKLP